MIIDTLGEIRNSLYYLGHKECPVYLLDGPEPVIFDAGITFAGKLYLEAIRSVLGDRQPSMLFLTHAHWDHCGSVSCLKEAFPTMKVAASRLSGQILQRPNAVALIRKLNEDFISMIESTPGLDLSILNHQPFRAFEVDIPLHDNQSIDLGEGKVLQVLATPGHTRDHLSYYLPGEKILIAGEAAGVRFGPEAVSSEFAADYDLYVSSLKRLAALPVEVFCQGHHSVLTGREEIRNLFRQSLSVTTSYKQRIMDLLAEEDGLAERVIERVKEEKYDVIQGPKQWESAYLLNLKAQVAHLAAKQKHGDGSAVTI